ncbi:hypothetical protein C5C07_13990 [Haloferax sp. Atlit-4N]|uniref:hypothetical protein n=1 Tax=Haloferax sp. Atlit-4N TaxID=2077206 RepID=UPI000E21D828|nr:hypothetical protein [Haloferax sp. Atlit-4N]RDZ52863.1 hypothetical protein C5C07_13990 [Haloferax sp. Atlit-4N]
MELPNSWNLTLSEKHDSIIEEDKPHAEYSREGLDLSVVVAHGNDFGEFGFHVLLRHSEVEYINEIMEFREDFDESRELAEQFVDGFENSYDGEEGREILKVASKVVERDHDLEFEFGLNY